MEINMITLKAKLMELINMRKLFALFTVNFGKHHINICTDKDAQNAEILKKV